MQFCLLFLLVTVTMVSSESKLQKMQYIFITPVKVTAACFH